MSTTTLTSPAGNRTRGTEPATMPALLRLLGADRKSLTQQWPVISAWLADHIPTHPLRCSMLANGYGLLLKGIG